MENSEEEVIDEMSKATDQPAVDCVIRVESTFHEVFSPHTVLGLCTDVDALVLKFSHSFRFTSNHCVSLVFGLRAADLGCSVTPIGRRQSLVGCTLYV